MNDGCCTDGPVSAPTYLHGDIVINVVMTNELMTLELVFSDQSLEEKNNVTH